MTTTPAVGRGRVRFGRTATRGVVLALAGSLLLGCLSSGTDVFSLEVGDCFQDPDTDADQISSVETVDCEAPHDNEVYAVFDLPDGDYPGPDVVSEASLEGCIDRFEEYVGTPYPESELYATWLFPSESSWEEEDDREVLCVLFAQGEQLEGSMEGSGR